MGPPRHILYLLSLIIAYIWGLGEAAFSRMHGLFFVLCSILYIFFVTVLQRVLFIQILLIGLVLS